MLFYLALITATAAVPLVTASPFASRDVMAQLEAGMDAFGDGMCEQWRLDVSDDVVRPIFEGMMDAATTITIARLDMHDVPFGPTGAPALLRAFGMQNFCVSRVSHVLQHDKSTYAVRVMVTYRIADTCRIVDERVIVFKLTAQGKIAHLEEPSTFTKQAFERNVRSGECRERPPMSPRDAALESVVRARLLEKAAVFDGSTARPYDVFVSGVHLHERVRWESLGGRVIDGLDAARAAYSWLFDYEGVRTTPVDVYVRELPSENTGGTAVATVFYTATNPCSGAMMGEYMAFVMSFATDARVTFVQQFATRPQKAAAFLGELRKCLTAKSEL
eukprot:CAMPEP_0198337870 /NCGR_PEP_ID=MMETSP1450-20131203/31468_1 /TAXON_ID=753684 ORGANISM="Madagascaria erythrocladiodes, Strain CCMP3234" /NCGR_SAMPLE_ID=MMETSP1450 /ASSEMBLY_ACC=CAM_ASM_001115 /LENGTH=331 /DNA_ID=CAMNT_0044042711 /DNA_START=114 /DNA_END=1109 /DNA_ORIENTATION=-